MARGTGRGPQAWPIEALVPSHGAGLETGAGCKAMHFQRHSAHRATLFVATAGEAVEHLGIGCSAADAAHSATVAAAAGTVAVTAVLADDGNAAGSAALAGWPATLEVAASALEKMS